MDTEQEATTAVEQGVIVQEGDTVLFKRPAKGGTGFVARKGRVKSLSGNIATVTESAEDEGTEVPTECVIPLYRMVPQPPPLVKETLVSSRVLRNVDKYID